MACQWYLHNQTTLYILVMVDVLKYWALRAADKGPSMPTPIATELRRPARGEDIGMMQICSGSGVHACTGVSHVAFIQI